MNGSDGLIREHFRARKIRVEKLQFEIMAQTRNRHPGKVHVIFTRYTCQPMDWDNHCASFKNVGDALVNAGVIKDDKPEIIVVFEPKQEKVKKRDEETVVLAIIDK